MKTFAAVIEKGPDTQLFVGHIPTFQVPIRKLPR
jgi:hypothetical protein